MRGCSSLCKHGCQNLFDNDGYEQDWTDELPPRQKEVFLLCMEGKKNREIAEQLDISAETVRCASSTITFWLSTIAGAVLLRPFTNLQRPRKKPV